MKIEAGKYYRTRGGDVVGPMRHEEAGSHFPWITLTRCWTIEGKVFRGGEGVESCMDLISEVYVSDTPPADAPAPEAKTLRDEFAMVALPISYEYIRIGKATSAFNTHALAITAYNFADAMMEARKK